jgi:uncharacterized protein (DUF1015 family)
VPVVRPFRALRYAREAVPDLAAVVAPPYDVIGEAEHRELLGRDPRNVVRLDFPEEQAGDPDPDERYRRAAHRIAAWRGDGTLVRDPRPTITVVEDSYRLPGSEAPRVRRGFFARVRLEPFGAGIRAHERTMSGPKEDRYKLLRATGVNTSPVVAMYEDRLGRAGGILDSVAQRAPATDLVDGHEVRHRAWTLVAGTDPACEQLCELASAATLTIADGHHRYETALRYRDERRRGVADDVELGSDEVLMLLLEPAAGPLDILATHRIVRGLGDDGVQAVLGRLGEAFKVESGVAAGRLVERFGGHAPDGSGAATRGSGTFGRWSRSGGALLHARPGALDAHLPPGGAALRRLDVAVLGAALEALLGIDAAAAEAGERIGYTKDAREAIDLVDSGRDGNDLAFLLDPTPAAEIMAVAADGDVMPQKSTYIHPKALTGLVLNPLES